MEHLDPVKKTVDTKYGKMDISIRDNGDEKGKLICIFSAAPEGPVINGVQYSRYFNFAGHIVAGQFEGQNWHEPYMSREDYKDVSHAARDGVRKYFATFIPKLIADNPEFVAESRVRNLEMKLETTQSQISSRMKQIEDLQGEVKELRKTAAVMEAILPDMRRQVVAINS